MITVNKTSLDRKEVEKAFKNWHSDSSNFVTPHLEDIDIIESLDGVPIVIELSRTSVSREERMYGVSVLMACDEEFRPVKDITGEFTSIAHQYNAIRDIIGLEETREDARKKMDDINKLVENLRVLQG